MKRSPLWSLVAVAVAVCSPEDVTGQSYSAPPIGGGTPTGNGGYTNGGTPVGGGGGGTTGGGGYGGGTGGNGGGGGDSAPAVYTFKWDVNDPPSGNFYGHEEDRNGVNTQGRYYVQLPDTRVMRVEYYVDDWGFHPTVTFEGTAVYPPAGSGGGGGGGGNVGGGYTPPVTGGGGTVGGGGGTRPTQPSGLYGLPQG